MATDRAIYCWGYNGGGQLGSSAYVDDLATDRPAYPAEVGDPVRAVFAGNNHTCAVTTNGTAKCWGDNWFGQLGDGTKTSRYAPRDVPGLTANVTDLDGSISHTCAVVAGGVKCWGWNGYGQLGDGTTTDRLNPANVVGLAAGATDVATGSGYTCAIGGGRVYCWGDNSLGQLGLSDPLFRTTPFDVLGSASARLLLNYTSGQPGSVFTLTGTGFPPGSTATVTANGQTLTTVAVNESGDFILFLDSAGSDPGSYYVTASVNPSATVLLVLDQAAPLRLPEGGGQTVVLPKGIALILVYLPLVLR